MRSSSNFIFGVFTSFYLILHAQLFVIVHSQSIFFARHTQFFEHQLWCVSGNFSFFAVWTYRRKPASKIISIITLSSSQANFAILKGGGVAQPGFLGTIIFPGLTPNFQNFVDNTIWKHPNFQILVDNSIWKNIP